MLFGIVRHYHYCFFYPLDRDFIIFTWENCTPSIIIIPMYDSPLFIFEYSRIALSFSMYSKFNFGISHQHLTRPTPCIISLKETWLSSYLCSCLWESSRRSEDGKVINHKLFILYLRDNLIGPEYILPKTKRIFILMRQYLYPCPIFIPFNYACFLTLNRESLIWSQSFRSKLRDIIIDTRG